MKKILALVISVLFVSSLSALEVDKSELEKSKNTTIEFINYVGPHKVIDSIEAIKGIGSGMAKQLNKDITKPSNSAASSKYQVIHAVDPNETGKLDADIILIGADATVDHINNLRRIISAYLSEAYGYSEKDADTLAVFITVYNAVYRGDLDTFQNKYKTVVTKNLSKSNCGLSVTYKDWPGKSEIVIPLFDVANGGLSTVDTSVISDTKVVSNMKEDDDMNVESRKDMVDIKEREAEEASDKAKESQKKAVEEQKKLDEEKKKTEETKKEAEDAKKKADEKQKVAEEKQKTAEENPKDKEAQKEAAEAKKEAEQAKTEAEEKQEAVEEQKEKQAEQEKKTEEAKDEAKEKQQIADKKNTEAQNERKEIAKDQNEIQKREAAEAKMQMEYGIILTDESEMLSRLVKFNKENGEVVKNSPVSVIRNRTIYKAGDSYLAIAGENTKNGVIKLVTIDPETMEIAEESESYIAADSVLIQDGNDYYCVIDEKGTYYLGKFGADLQLKLKSDVKIKSCTPVTITDSGIVVTDSDGKLKVLDKSDLKNK